MNFNQKFLFDRDFDVEKVRQQQQQAEQEHAASVPPPPTFDEETFNAARQDAYQQGLRDGLQQAEQSQQQMLMGLWDRVGHKLGALLERDQNRDAQAQSLAIKSAFHIVKKFWPKLQQTSVDKDVEQFVADHLAANNEEGRLVLRVNDMQLDAVAAQIPRLKELQGFQGKIITLADDSVMAGDCKIEWADGGAEKLGRHIMQQLDQLMERLLGNLTRPALSQQPADDIYNGSTEGTERIDE